MSPEPSNKIGKSVGEKLRAARIAQRYTQSQLASPDFSVSYISAIERGQIHPSLRALEILASRLGLTATQLLPNRSQGDDRYGMLLSIPEREDDEMEITLLEANIHIRQGEVEQAVTQLSKLSIKRLKRQQQLYHRYLLGWAYFKAGKFQESEYTLSEALQIVSDQNAQYISARILDILALTYAAMRNYPQAILSHQRCLHILEAEEPQDPFFIGQVYMHMGQHYTHLNNVEQALEMFHNALAVIGKSTSSDEIQNVYLEVSRQYAEKKDYDIAAQYAYKSLYLNESKNRKRLRSELYHFSGRAMIKGGQNHIETFLTTALQQETGTQDRLTQSSLHATKAKWHFERQELEAAEKHAQCAHELAHASGDNIIGAEAYIILGRIHYARGDFQLGDLNFSSGLDMLERLERHEELAEEAVNYAQLLEEHGKEREAFAFFRRAYQSRQKTGK